MQDSNSLNTKIATVALAYHLDSTENISHKVAASALAMFLDVSGGNEMSKIIAQIALAMHLESNPNASFSAPNKFANVVSNNSSWGSKILLMRQSPIRR